MIMLAKWVSRGGAFFVDLYNSDDGYYYVSNYRKCDCIEMRDGKKVYVGMLTMPLKNRSAITEMQARVNAGQFQPSGSKLPMEKII